MTDLDRFVAAQATTHAAAEAEIARGRKTSHWMWYVFPQLRGLGTSANAWTYGIADGAEAAAYLAHPLLGDRLRRMVRLLMAHRDRPAEAILDAIDALKLRSCLTLFRDTAVDPADRRLFADALDAFYDGAACPETRRRLAGTGPPSPSMGEG